jgi:hypothetical protein
MSLEQFEFDPDRKSHLPARQSKPSPLHPLIFWCCIVYLVTTALSVLAWIVSEVQLHRLGG